MSRYCCSDDMSGMAFPPPSCGNNKSGAQRCLTVILLCASFAFIVTYFYYGFTEIQNELSVLRKDISPSQAAQPKRSRCDQKKGGINNEDVKALVKAAIRQYDADKTIRADFALESSGGSIVSTVDTEPFESSSRSGTLFGIPICQNSNGPRQIIQPGVMPGECWAFKGSQGVAIIRLLGPVFVDGISLEHIPRELSPTGLIDTAPKVFSVRGLQSEKDSGELLGEFTYDIDGPTLQTFNFDDETRNSYEYIEFKVHSNHGSSIFTCVYRLRVHGSLDTSKQVEF